MDWRVVKFITQFQYMLSEQSCSQDEKVLIIETAIANRRPLKIVYLKPDDTKSNRIVQPGFVGQIEFKGRSFLGLKAFCLERQEERTFRLDRILEIDNNC